ncbi:MAG: hypothetical protein IKZ43_07425 [Acidaminococcaceae bacterium]|nr:hypothetical protein [Acidaminococcaceae bacterium]
MGSGFICYYEKRLEPCAKCGSTIVTYEGVGPRTKKHPCGIRTIIICRDCGHRTQHEHPDVESAEEEWNSEFRG